MCASMTCSQLVDAYLTSVIDCMYDTWLHTVRMKYLAGCILLVIPPSIPFLDGGRDKSLRCASIPSVQDVQRSGFDLNRQWYKYRLGTGLK